jgi:phage/plasmid-like protein (TIGR03299 family)
VSQETMEWLNNNTLIGFTDKRGNAWHYRKADQGVESNHYPGAIPVEDVRRRLFNWKVVEGDVTSKAAVLTPEGVLSFSITDPDRKAMLRPPGALGEDDPGGILGLFKLGFQGHDFDTWLLDEIAKILSQGLDVSSAGLLKMGAIGWVEISVPETITTPEGVTFRPNLLAGTSFDGSLATTYKRTAQNTVCDNTMSVALRSEGEVVRIKHSRYSNLKLAEVRDALALVHTIADDFAAQVAELTNTVVSEGDWSKFLDSFAPLPEEEKGRSRTMAENKRAALNKLWFHDTRVSPWKDTAYGVVQAVNTFTHHEGIVRGADRAERNMERAVTGGVDKLDADTLATLEAVLA